MRKFLLLSTLFVCLAFVESSAQCTPPSTSLISGPASICGVNSYGTYSVTATTGSTYVWTVTGGTVYSIPAPFPAPPSPPSNITGVPTTNSAVNVMWTGIGIQSLTVVETTSAGCAGTPINFAVTINPTPAPVVITGSNPACTGINMTYSVPNTPGMTYSWGVSAGTIVGPNNNNSVTVNWTGSTGWGGGPPANIGVSITNSLGCSTYTSMGITLNNPPVLSASSSSTYLCVGSNITLTPTTGGTWTSSNQSVATITSSGIVTGVSSGTATFTFTQTSTGCSKSTGTFTVRSGPTTSAISGNSAACANSSELVYTVTGSTGNYYSWSVTDGGVTQTYPNSGNTFYVSWKNPGQGNLSVIETDTWGCAGQSVNLPITINPLPSTSVISGNALVCVGASGVPYTVVNTPGSTYNWTIRDGTQASGGTSNSVTVNWGGSSSQYISVTETNSAGCVGYQQLNVATSYVNTGSISGNNTVCANSNGVSYSVTNTSGSTYVWTIVGGTQATGSNSNSITVNWGSAVSGSVKVVETNSNGCVGYVVTLPVAIGTPNATAITGSAVVCPNASGVSYSVPFNSGSTYSWTISGGGSQASGANTNYITVNWGPVGTGNVSVVETAIGGCVGSPINLPVTIKPVTTSSITGNALVCINTNGVAYNVTNTTGSSYNWTITGGNVASGQGTNAITVNWTVAGAGNVKVVETSTAGCVGTAVNKSVTVNALPVTSSITGLSSVCPNASGVAYSVTNTTGSTYAWTVTGTGSSLVNGNGTNAITVNWGSAGTGTVKVIETNVNGCVGVAVTKSVTINANPNTSAISGSATACPNATGITYSVTNTAGSTYNWTVTGGTKASGGTTNSITVTWGTGGNGNVNVIETNAAGCVGTAVNKAVTVSPLTSPISGSVKVCPNSNCVAYSVTNVPGDTYTWTVTGGTLTCGQNTNIVIVNWGAAGSGTLSVTERSATCTGVAVNLPVAITASPATSAITGNSAVCPYATNSSYSVTNTAGSTYLWTVCGGIIASGNNTNSILVNWGANGPGNISVVETSSTGCIGTAVNKTVSITSITTGIITGSSSMCLPANGIIYSVPNTVGSSYAWTVNGGTVVSGAGTNSITVNWTLAGPGLVSVVETNSAGCVGNTVTQPVQVNPKPATPAITGNNSVCPNATGISYSVTNTPGSIYIWTISGGTPAAPSTTNSIAVNWGAVGTGNVNVVETNNFGCVGLPVNLPITINALPTITVTPASASIGYGGSVSLTASGASTYSWSPSTGLNTTTGATVIASPSATTTYTVSGTDSHGCVNTKTVPVSLTCTPPSVYISSSNGLNLCKFTSTTLTATPISGATYTWTSSAGDYSKTGTTTNGGNTLLVYDEETYTVSVNVSGCFGSASATTYRTGTNCVGIARVAAGSQPTKPTESEDGPKGHKISVHPNPANHEVIVETPKRAEQDTQVVLYDMMGRVSGSGILKKGEWQVTISTSEVANGMYVVRIGTGDQANAEKVIIEHK